MLKCFTTILFLLLFMRMYKTQIAPPPDPAPGPPSPPSPPAPGSKPMIQHWVGTYEANQLKRSMLAEWLLTGTSYNRNSSYDFKENTEYEGYDGWYNNLARPDLGAIDRPLLRRWPAAYEDGSYEPTGKNRPNPLTLSEELLSGDIGTQSKTGKNALLVFFGQQVVEEILDAQRAACPPEYFNIDIPENHRYRTETGHTVLPFLRTRYDMRTGYSPNNPRQQLNEITPYLDGGLIYGSTKSWSDYLRKYKNGSVDAFGRLASYEDKGLYPEINTERLPMANPPPPFYHKDFIKKHELFEVSRFFKLGNPRGNENTFLLTFGILWFRWHNYIATALKKENPHWNSEQIFNEARKWVIASQQHLVINKWLPEWLGENLPAYEKYDPSIDPQIDQFFQTAAMRFGHTLVVPGVYLRDYGRNGCSFELPGWSQKAIRTCNAYWRPQEAIQAKYSANEDMDIDRVLMGMALQMCEREDHTIVEDLRGNVFGPLEFSRRDLMAVNIQRARDHGVPDYNTARKAYNLRPVNSIQHFTNIGVTKENAEKLYSLYDENWNNIDIWVGGIMETENRPGELFRTIIKDQFTRIRNADRFWFENENNGLFTKAEIDRIKQLEVYDMIMAVTKLDSDDIPENVFGVPVDNVKIHSNCRSKLVESPCTPINSAAIKCYHLPQLNTARLEENCTITGTYDYFYNSEVSYILTFLAVGVFITGITILVWFLTKRQLNMNEVRETRDEMVRQSFKRIKYTPYTAQEWVGHKSPLNYIVLILNIEKKQIQINTQRGTLLRAMDFAEQTPSMLEICICGDRLHLMLKMENEYSLVLKFESEYLREGFLQALENFVETLRIQRFRINLALKPMLKQAVTKADRQKQLDMFFRVVFAQAFKINHPDDELLRVDSKSAQQIINTELTITEFAEALSMKADSEFVRRIFTLIDRDRNNFVSFREFLDLLFIFAKGSGEEKAKLLFDMYDINHTGFLTESDFKNMISSLMATVHASVNPRDLEETINTLKRDARIRQGGMNFDDFYKLFKDDLDKIGNVNIGFRNADRNINASHLDRTVDEVESLYADHDEIQNRIGGADHNATRRNSQLIDEEQERTMVQINLQENKTPTFLYGISRYVETNMREIFWVLLYTIVLLAIFAERAYYYSVEREHSGLRRIAGYGVTVTRGAASGMMFTYSTLLLTMCRNTISLLRDTFLNKYIPFDKAIEMHKYIACWGLFFTILHIIGHSFNFYHISTQTADDLTCLFRNYFHATHELPKFHYWCWQTMTGFTGIVLTLICAVIYVCAIPGVSRKLFWIGHALYPFFYIFMILHGLGRLIQEPFFPNFFIGPLILYILDMLVSASRRKVEIRVLHAELLPSGVTKLEFKRPSNFEYKSGQWVRIACLAMNSSEFHPFTLSSSPNESNLTLHIRAVGPWTRSIRQIYDVNMMETKMFPKIHLDGPYGESHQDWYRYEVSVLVGGGIGVTPFASILKDIVFRANSAHRANCKKVYFIWVTKTQQQFEWLVDIIRELEASDSTQTVSIHLFVTQFFHKFDLRTTLLYICERHFQRISGKSLFTGLKAITHFGRPTFPEFFKSLQSLHPDVQNIGVFSCGPAPMTTAVDQACAQLNKSKSSSSTFHHHYKIY